MYNLFHDSKCQSSNFLEFIIICKNIWIGVSGRILERFYEIISEGFGEKRLIESLEKILKGIPRIFLKSVLEEFLKIFRGVYGGISEEIHGIFSNGLIG